jgi:hypothetical protein
MSLPEACHSCRTAFGSQQLLPRILADGFQHTIASLSALRMINHQYQRLVHQLSQQIQDFIRFDSIRRTDFF